MHIIVEDIYTAVVVVLIRAGGGMSVGKDDYEVARGNGESAVPSNILSKVEDVNSVLAVKSLPVIVIFKELLAIVVFYFLEIEALLTAACEVIGHALDGNGKVVAGIIHIPEIYGNFLIVISDIAVLIHNLLAISNEILRGLGIVGNIARIYHSEVDATVLCHCGKEVCGVSHATVRGDIVGTASGIGVNIIVDVGCLIPKIFSTRGEVVRSTLIGGHSNGRNRIVGHHIADIADITVPVKIGPIVVGIGTILVGVKIGCKRCGEIIKSFLRHREGAVTEEEAFVRNVLHLRLVTVNVEYITRREVKVRLIFDGIAVLTEAYRRVALGSPHLTAESDILCEYAVEVILDEVIVDFVSRLKEINNILGKDVGCIHGLAADTAGMLVTVICEEAARGVAGGVNVDTGEGGAVKTYRNDYAIGDLYLCVINNILRKVDTNDGAGGDIWQLCHIGCYIFLGNGIGAVMCDVTVVHKLRHVLAVKDVNRAAECGEVNAVGKGEVISVLAEIANIARCGSKDIRGKGDILRKCEGEIFIKHGNGHAVCLRPILVHGYDILGEINNAAISKCLAILMGSEGLGAIKVVYSTLALEN